MRDRRQQVTYLGELNELNKGRTKTCWNRPETAKNAKKTP